VADLVLEQVGDVLGCRFEGEEDVALFLPGSGDVLLASLEQWRTLTLQPSISDKNFQGDAPVADALTPPEVSGELKSTLLSLGAALA
jgi:hypothetical protein